MRPTMEIRGLEGVKGVISDIGPKHSRNILRATVHAMATELKDEIKENTPTDGPPVNLKKTFKAKRQRSSRTFIRSSVVSRSMSRSKGGKPVGPVWRWLEFGTVKIYARGFIRRTVDRFMPKIPNVFMVQFGKKLEASVARALKRKRGK